MDELARLDATAQAALVQRGEAKPVELVEAAVRRIERVDPQVNAVVVTWFDRAVEEAASGDLADGPFRGVPYVLKDCVRSAGDPMYLAMRRLRDVDWRDSEDDVIVARLRAAGFVGLGRSNMPEIQGGISTEPAVYGPTRNPWDPERSSAGSSGGSAAAVAAGLVPVALAVDGGGSIRIPSSVCGVVGLKPSRGRNSRAEGFAIDDQEGYNTPHVITRSVRDAARILDCVHGCLPGESFSAPPPSRPYGEELSARPGRLRIGMWTPTPGFPHVDPACVSAMQETARVLESLGHLVEPSHPAALDEGVPDGFLELAAALQAHVISRVEQMLGVALTEEDVEPVTWLSVVVGRQIPAVRYQHAVEKLRHFARRWARWWSDGGYDLLLTPTMAVRPFPLGSLSPPSPDAPWPDVTPWIPFTMQYNVSGQPAISLPLHWDDEGLPIGVQLGAAFGREDLLIRVAAQLEEARPWADRVPAIHA